MLNYIVGAGLALAVVLAIVGLVFLIKARKISKSKKTAYKYTNEQKINSIIDAVKGLARNNGQGNAGYIIALDRYNVDQEVFKQLKVNNFADTQKVDDKKVVKLHKVKA